VAKMGATLHLLTEGRFILGIGAGWKEDELLAYGFDFPQPASRVKRLEEAVQIIRMLWTEETPSFKGKWYRIENAHFYPKPYPPPPIMIGGKEKGMLKLVAEYADWWSCMSPALDGFEEKLEILEKYCMRTGREVGDIKLVANMYVLTAPTEESVRRSFDRNPMALVLKKSGRKRGFAFGTPDQLINKFGELIDLGINHYTIRFVDFPSLEGTKLFSEQVIPYFK
jgi:alkanesulfonate monooxygenase SsuD/methylene tetrahydromethanopterin reductase-like flavin-dependent oxidoreductase (luciferase family)